MSASGGILCSNYRAEVLALLNDTETIIFIRLTLSPASPHVCWTWHNAKEAHREHQHPCSVYLYCSLVDTSTHPHQGKWNRSACKTKKGKGATPLTSALALGLKKQIFMLPVALCACVDFLLYGLAFDFVKIVHWQSKCDRDCEFSCLKTRAAHIRPSLDLFSIQGVYIQLRFAVWNLQHFKV